jgi:hypothetical protein
MESIDVFSLVSQIKSKIKFLGYALAKWFKYIVVISNTIVQSLDVSVQMELISIQ